MTNMISTMKLVGSRREALTVVALCIAWYAISSASNVVGKLVLTDFPFPLTLTMVQLLSIVVLSPPAFFVCGLRRPPSLPRVYYLRVLVPLAFAKFLTVVFSQVSIWKVPISYAHTVKATTPLWTAGLARLLFGERQPVSVQLALMLIAAGVALASVTELHFDGLGLAAALAASALLSLQHLYSKRVMRDTHIHHLRLLQVLGRMAFMMFTPVWVMFDGVALWSGAAQAAGTRVDRWWVWCGALLTADGALAWLQAVVAFSVLSRVSPLAYAVASAAKRAAVIAVSLLVLQNPASVANVAGMALAGLGVLAYNQAKLHARSEVTSSQDNRPLLPV